jgi:hypothetical protein
MELPGARDWPRVQLGWLQCSAGKGSLVHSLHHHSTYTQHAPARRSLIPVGQPLLLTSERKNKGGMQANRPSAITRELRLRQYHYWVSTRNATNDADGADLARPTLGRQPTRNQRPPHCDANNNRESPTKRWRWGGGRITDGVKSETHR